MLETLISLLTAVLLAAPTGQSIEITNTVHREGDDVYQQYETQLDGERWSEAHAHIDCTSPTRDAICDVTESTPDLVVHHSRTKGEDGNWYIRREVRVGEDVSWTGSSALGCDTLTFGGLCTALDTIDAIGQ
jgi:hypothetical protein